MITTITFIPLVAALAIVLAPSANRGMIKILALVGTLISSVLAIQLVLHFDFGGELQFVEKYAWIPSIGVDYFLGIDGLNALLVLLVAFLSPIFVLASWKVDEKAKTYFSLLCLQITALYGAFTALNFFHWFIFWEGALVPVFFLIKLYGGDGRHKAAISFFIFTVLGSVAMLLGVLLLYLNTGSFDFIELRKLAVEGVIFEKLGVLYPTIFVAVMLGLWVKVPLFPLHPWQAAAYAEAPVAVSMVLTGVMSKMGVYGFLRLVVPVFPEAIRDYSNTLLNLTLITILWGAFLALRQSDIKRILAYSSLNHVAYCMFGIFAVGAAMGVDKINAPAIAMQGAILQMFAHGIGASGLFYVAGKMEEVGGTRDIRAFGGLGTVMPRYAFVFSFLIFSSLGLPFLAGFAAEILIFSGVFSIAPIHTGFALLGLLATAIFLLTIIQRIFTGKTNATHFGATDISYGEVLIILPLLVLTVWIGVAPSTWLILSDQFVQTLVSLLIR
ncbi:MAG: NADH-quinone oxidoreductase subunit M [Opitutaceae bacterium]|nr:NADH-quinone oxidoreductase subunit M [Opitutaceae bacterium]|tara:strand:- start:11880 stop:13376 length:1497 start_codon:yes stop_codon:yes gene_type:complete